MSLLFPVNPLFARGGKLPVEFIAQATTVSDGVSKGSLVIDKPPGTVASDLMIAFMCADSIATTWIGDTDWTEIVDPASGTSLRMAYKVAGIGEGSSYTFTPNLNRRLSGAILTYRNAVFGQTGVVKIDGNPVVLAGLTLTDDELVLASFTSRRDSSFSTPTDFTSRAFDSNASAPGFHIFDKSFNAGATGTVSSTSTVDDYLSGVLVSIKQK